MAVIPTIVGKVVAIVTLSETDGPRYSHRVTLRDARVGYFGDDDKGTHESLTVWVPRKRTGPVEFKIGETYVFFAFRLSDAEVGYETEGWRRQDSTWQESPSWRDRPRSAPSNDSATTGGSVP